LCQHLDRERYEPTVFCLMGEGPFAEPIEAAGIPVRVLFGGRVLAWAKRLLARGRLDVSVGRLSSPPAGWRGVVRRGGLLIAEVLSTFELAFQLRVGRFQLVSAHWGGGRGGVAAAWIARVRCVYTEHSIVKGYYSHFEQGVLRVLVPLAQRVIAVSQACRQSLIDDLHINPGNIDVVGHAVLLPPERSSAQRPPGPPTVAALGALSVHKGHVYLLRALASLRVSRPSLRCLLLGDGPLRLDLQREAERLGVTASVEFRGAYRNNQLSELLKEVDLVVIPSLSESLGIVALEAMACAKPVVASNTGGLAEIVQHEVTGYLVPPADPVALAKAIDKLLTDACLRERMGQVGQAFASQMTPTAIAAATMEVYERALC
jgi:glycosyltransferase involved in cell wall biosynthesis